ncbi:Ubiquitin carboxyl-terminal hydrolase 30-like isoform X3 [Oopsacas minuta]|uniref:Ubiquitin carboxyl-terminal hydrolase n=1 Tax=Oopsacas minuta TaxID=111878 RepID=A0AAV7JCL5_9METZ|nr:Ubiquitin carboxyl-terminal hydrolase 30-like isoform X3 [Oopsacas minuta]
MDYVTSIASPIQSLLTSLDSLIFGQSHSSKSRTGLLNHGNTCFLNSVIQSLVSLNSFDDWLSSDENLGGQVHVVLSELLHKMHSSTSQPHATDKLFSTLMHSGWKRSLHEQQDAHEFFQFLASTLQYERSKAHQQETTLSNLLLMPRLDPVSIPGVQFSKHIGFMALNKSITPLPFHGTIFTDITCSLCHTRKPSRYQSVLSISLELPNIYTGGVVPLSQLISHYLQTSRVDMVECRLCALRNDYSRTSCAYKTCLGKIPQCLCIHLQRTQFHPYGFLYKTQTQVDFPINLDLGNLHADPIKPHFLSSMSLGPCSNLNGGVFQSNSLFKNQKLPSLSHPSFSLPTSQTISSATPSRATYNLKSVVEHLGEDSSTGHYVSYCRLRDPKSWVFCSDETVRHVTPDRVKKAQAYMLFYERSPS